jgi:hypothetical protein
VESLETLGVSRDCIFYQPDISLVDQENHWVSQWLYAQRHSKVVVCMLSCAYLRSKPCCIEWKLIPEWQRLVVGVDTAVELLKTDLTGFNGPPLAYVQCGEQMLDARTSTPTHIAAKIIEKYEANREKSHAIELRRGSPAGEELEVLGDSVAIPSELSVPGGVERRFSLPKILRTPPPKFLIPSPNAEAKGSGDDDSKSGKRLPKVSPSRLGPPNNELDAYRLTPSRASREKDKSWFG